MSSRKLLTGAALGVFVLAAVVGALWPASSAAAPQCSWCRDGQSGCSVDCSSTYPNDPAARAQCILGCIDQWTWCFNVCI